MKYLKKILLVAVLPTFILGGCNVKNELVPWVSLFDGQTLEGWNKKNGEAIYFVEDSAIVGKATINTPNTFLCTNEVYTDFIFELDVKVDGNLNSGIQFRSNSMPDHNDGRVHGYQSEIDPSPRSWTAGIYDEGRRGWLNPLDGNPLARAAYQHQEWNKVRIEAIGDTLKTFLNGIIASHLIDGETAKGFFGLQVHGIGNNKAQEGITVRWKNIRIITENPQKYATKAEIPAITTKK